MKRVFIVLLLLSLVIGMTGCVITVPNITAPSLPQNQTPATPTPKQPLDTGWSPPQLQTEAPTLPSIADVVEKVYPSVVAINTEVVTMDIFRTPLTQEGAGSGWIID